MEAITIGIVDGVVLVLIPIGGLVRVMTWDLLDRVGVEDHSKGVQRV